MRQISTRRHPRISKLSHRIARLDDVYRHGRGSHVGRRWDTYSKFENLYAVLVNARGYDNLDEHICEDILKLSGKITDCFGISKTFSDYFYKRCLSP